MLSIVKFKTVTPDELKAVTETMFNTSSTDKTATRLLYQY